MSAPKENGWCWLETKNILVPQSRIYWTMVQYSPTPMSKKCLECDVVDGRTENVWFIVKYCLHMVTVKTAPIVKISDYMDP
jgi:hypothetical protein